MQLEMIRYEFVLEAVEPIAHHQETIGNEAVVMRRKVRLPGGGFARVPYITGNALRHGLRAAASMAVLDAAGLLEGEGPQLSTAALSLLFAGGQLGGKGNAKVINLEAYAELVDIFPPLSLFGGCTTNRIIPGRIRVSEATLICAESAHLLPEWVGEHTGQADTSRGHIESVTRVRMDPMLRPTRRALLDEASRAEHEGRLLESETASAARDHAAADESKSSMMPFSFERLCAGSRFWWSIEADTYSPLELDTLKATISAYFRSIRVGGKQGSGHGLLRVVAGENFSVQRPAEAAEALDLADLDQTPGRVLRAHVSERRERLAEWLRSAS